MIGSSEVPGMIYKSIIGHPDIKITKEYFDQRQYSFAKVQFGKGPVIIMTLAYVDGENYEWRSQDNSSLVTRHGKVIRTSGLKYNRNIILSDSFDFKLNSADKIEYLVQFSNPHAITSVTREVSLASDRESIYYLGEVNSSLVEERLNLADLGSTYVNKYWIDENYQTLSTEQFIHPFLPILKIDYFFKY
jgi:hypothetical protein